LTLEVLAFNVVFQSCRSSVYVQLLEYLVLPYRPEIPSVCSVLLQ